MGGPAEFAPTDPIHRGMTIGSVIRQFSGSAEILRQFGIPCCECGLALIDTLEVGARIHGIDLELLLDDLNRAHARAAPVAA